MLDFYEDLIDFVEQRRGGEYADLEIETVTRDELLAFAEMTGEKPAFLFPSNQQKTPLEAWPEHIEPYLELLRRAIATFPNNSFPKANPTLYEYLETEYYKITNEKLSRRTTETLASILLPPDRRRGGPGKKRAEKN